MPKRELRLTMLDRRNSMTPEECSRSSALCQERLMRLAEYRASVSIALYAPIRNEVDTASVFRDALSRGKRVMYPAVTGSGMIFRDTACGSDLASGKFGIPEPQNDPCDHDAATPDIIIVPGVAFHASGHRLGFGKGYYDRALAVKRHGQFFIGFCHDFQLTERAFPTGEHDVRMDIIICASDTLRC